MSDALLKLFPLGMIFRAIFPGGFFAVSFVVASHGWGRIADMGGEALLASWLPLAFFAGVVAYTIHRSVIYPPIEALLDYYEDWREDESAKRPQWRRLIRDGTISEIFKRWKLGTDTRGKETAELARHISTWADYAHFQYVSAICTALGGLSGIAMVDDNYNPGGHPYWRLTGLLFAALALFASGLVSDWRLNAVIYRIRA